jgi:hypothetical protein
MTRAKGYVGSWNPQPRTLAILRAVIQILAEYGEYGPMTLRQIFYRLVGEYGYAKTENAYESLGNHVVKARRAGLIPWDAIRDDGSTVAGAQGWEGRRSFWRSVRKAGDDFERDHQEGQAQRIELWCEAAGMVPMLTQMTAQWHVPIYSSGGFTSVTLTHEVAMRVEQREVPTVFLHVGDYDPSGESIFTSMTEDIEAFLSDPAQFEPVRVALTAAQVAQYDLPTAPPKKGDSRTRNWAGGDATTQAEALPPPLLRDIVVGQIEFYTDPDVLADVIEREGHDKAEIDRVLKIAEAS